MEIFKIRHKQSGKYWNGQIPQLDRSFESFIKLYFNPSTGFDWEDVDRLKQSVDWIWKKRFKEFIKSECEVVYFQLNEINKISFL